MTVPADALTDDEVRDAEFAAAIAGDQRWPTWSLDADWYADGSYAHPLSALSQRFEITSLTISRELSGDLPPEVGLVEGRASAQLDVSLAVSRDPDTGEVEPDSTDPVRAFAPYDPDAPLFGVATVGTKLTADLGLETESGPQSRRRFTGTIASVSPRIDPNDPGVDLTALDGAARMSAPITQQATGMDGIVAARYGPDRYNCRTNSSWLVDRIFRANGYYASPPPEPNSFVSATCHGSLTPEIGGGGVPQRANPTTPSNPDAWVTGGHPFGMMYANPDGLKQQGVWTSPEQLTMFAGDGVGCSMLVRMPSTPSSPFLGGILYDGGPIGPNGVTAGSYAVLVVLNGGAPGMVVYTPANGAIGVGLDDYVRPREPTWRHLGFHWAFKAPANPGPSLTQNVLVDCVMTISIDGDNYDPYVRTLNLGNAGSRPNPWAPSTTVEFSMGVPFTNVSWFHTPIAPEEGQWVAAKHTSQADVDPGMNELTGIPQLSGEDSWPLLCELAAAEAATIGFGGSAFDRPYFRSRAVHRTQADPETLTSHRDLAALTIRTDESSVRNSISSAVTPLLVGDYEWVKESKDPTEFECGIGANYFPVTLPADTVLVDPWSIYQMGRTYWEAFADHPYYRDSFIFSACYADNPLVPVGFNLIDFRLYPGGPGELILAIYNFTGRTIRFATCDLTDSQGQLSQGSAALKLPGRLLKAQAPQPQVITDPGSVKKFGYRTFEVGGSGSSRWHQHPKAVRGVAEAILAQTAHPAPILDTVTVPADPRRDLGDPVRLVDPHGLGSVRGRITGIRSVLEPGAPFDDELTVRPIAPPGFGVLGDEELGRIGSTLRFGA